MDTVEGRKGGKVLLTLHFTNCNLMIACLRDRNDSKSVIEFFDSLDNTLGNDNFKKLFPVILTDNGSEFSNPSAIESHGCKVFYCNPSAPYEKGACEVNHEFIRRISPKGQSFNDLSQDTVNLMMSHINSYGRKILNDKSPIDCFTTLYSQELLELLNIKTIKSDDINLTPSLIKKEGK